MAWEKPGGGGTGPEVPAGHNGAGPRRPREGALRDKEAGGLPPMPSSVADRIDNRSRAQLMRTIEEQPGLSIQELSEILGLSRGAIRHHVVHLARDGYVESHRQGNHRLHFATAMPVMRRKAILLLRIGSIRSVVDATIEDPRFRADRLADDAGISVRSVRRGLKLLERTGLVHKEAARRGVHNLSFHPELRIAWVLYFRDAGRREVPPLRTAPGWVLGFELLLGKFAFGTWAAS